MDTATRVPSETARLRLAIVVSAIVVANVAVIIWLWLRDGGITGIHDTASLLTSLGRITGLLGAYLLLIQVLLLARLRRLEQLVGFDRLTVWHRTNGKVCFYLILAHVALVTAGYTVTDGISLWSEVTNLWTIYPGIPDAVIGTALLIAVVVTSFVVVRRRLRYEAWYVIHLTSYLAVALAWFHQLPTGNDFILNPSAAVWWSALYVVTLALVIVFRIWLPILFAFQYQLKVADVRTEGPNVVSLRLTGRNLQRMRARAGQFFLWRFLTPRLVWESHPFSLSAAPDGQSLRITVKHLGDFTSRIGEIKPGTRVIGVGPFGLFTEEIRRCERAALIAGGVGITPIRSLLEEMSGDIVLLYRVNRAEEVVFREELQDLERRKGVRVHYVIGRHDAPGGEFLLSPDHLKDLIPDIASRDIYICGPPAMADMVDISVRRAGVPARQIHTESFAFSPAPSPGAGGSGLSSRARPAIVVSFGAIVAVVVGRFAWLSTHPWSPTVAAVPTAIPTAIPTTAPAAAPAGPTATTAAARATPTAAPSAVAGPTVQTQYGPVQVTITASGKKITSVAVAISPQDPRSQSIETGAIPMLKQETLQAQSANINTVSGATVVSDAYIQSLQSALSRAGI
ncbi:MAG TPA: ferric reductase-like transmembrane domain-containing protein [Chloroflexota bacterium]